MNIESHLESLSAPSELALLAAEKIKSASGIANYDLALALGSGWAGAADTIGEQVAEIPAEEIPGFEATKIPGHLSAVRSVKFANGKCALILGARIHLYEGKGVRAVAHGVRTAAACGAKTIILTNGAGGIKETWPPGTPVLISDHINLTAVGPVEGAKFIDLTDLYSSRLREIAKSVDPSLDEGIYVQFRGPHYETPAEVQMAKRLGGHIVGMSTAIEAVAAREAGMEVLGLSLVTNLAAGISREPLTHQEVIDAGMNAGPALSQLLAAIVQEI